MPDVRPTICLIATWRSGQNPYLDNPAEIAWDDGSPGTLDDYAEHMASTHRYVRDDWSGVTLYMWPEIIADLRWDEAEKAWAVSGPCVNPATLSYLGRNASDGEIVAALYRFPVVYRARIFRGNEVNPPVHDASRVIRVTPQKQGI